MITCEQYGDGMYQIKELTAEDLEMMEESLCYIFNQSRKEEHRPFRKHVLQIVTPISDMLDKINNH